MRLRRVLAASVFAVACLAMLNVAFATAIAVGSSSLIGTLDYSDTFTTSANGGNSARVDSQWALNDVATAAQVENTYGHAAESWTYSYSTAPKGFTNFGSFVSDATAVSGYSYPGSSNAGSATGMVQTGVTSGTDFGIAYNLRSDYVVQIDGVQSSDRLDMTTSGAKDSLTSAHGLTVFFRKTGSTTEIGLYNASVGESNTGISSGVSAAHTWHNYAVRFNLAAGLLDIYTDQTLRGEVNLKTFDSGAYWNVVDASTNDYVSVGGNSASGTGMLWTDNFQVGAPMTPEPSSMVILLTGLIGLLAYAWRKRK